MPTLHDEARRRAADMTVAEAEQEVRKQLRLRAAYRTHGERALQQFLQLRALQAGCQDRIDAILAEHDVRLEGLG